MDKIKGQNEAMKRVKTIKGDQRWAKVSVPFEH